jgi:DNA polymerase-3 subunit epsilon/CBS domain-containing protein
MAALHNPASIQLLSLNAIAFDSETTGLDTSQARMIQLGAVRILHGEVDESQSFQSLINPDLPIPPASQAIHGISDADVASAPNFGEVVQSFDDWCQDSVLVGYASGFDLAMLKREKQLAGLEWVAPRCLDVRFMVNLLGPNLPDFSLDTIAGWVGVEIQHRHSALGDAIATGAIFVALIPKLRERGIRTLAEVERACQRFSESGTRETQIGWLDIQQAKNTRTTLARIDSFPYRHRLRDLMSSPPLLIDPGISLREALMMLIDQQVSSLFVHAGEVDARPGIITERDLLRKFREVGDAAFTLPVREAAVYPLVSLSADSFVYRAIARMKRLHVRHLGVHDSHGNIVGALSARDLLRQRADDAILLGDDIDAAENAAQMSAVWGTIVLVAKSLVAEDVDVRDIAAVISSELCALTRQACKLVERNMATPPPCPYAMLVLGSGGRGESLLAMDQDNAIVYAAGEPDGPEDQWFAELGRQVAAMLDAAGVPYCKGNIMASNSDWRRSRQDWQEVLQTWLRRQSPEDILNCDIFFDAVCVQGDVGLANAVLDYAFEQARETPQFTKLMSINACKNAPPLGLFGRFKLDDGRMDLKMGGIMPLFSSARVLAIKHGVRELSTPQRFAAVSESLGKMQSTLQNLCAAHRIIFNTILQQQLLDLEAGILLSNRVAPGNLSSAQRDQLKWALEQVPNVSNLLGDPLSHI